MKTVTMTSFVNKRNPTVDIHWLPHSVGCLIAHAMTDDYINDNYKFLTPLYNPWDYEEYKDILQQTDILCLTNYVWNQTYNDGISMYYKKLNPNGTVLYGGASVPNTKITHKHTHKIDLM